MEFGKLANIDGVDWSLPEDSSSSIAYLRSLPREGPTKFWIGAPAWSHKEWTGKVYPSHAKPADYLHHYARFFNSIELNTTHYRIPTDEQAAKWLEQVEGEFLFCPKMPQTISHSMTGLLDRELLKPWWKFLEAIEGRRGPCFMQLPPGFDYSRKALLHQFLRGWPPEFDLCLEFRHPSWFEGRQILPALRAYLQDRGVGLVITDVAGRRDVLHASISAPYTMIRFVGNDMHPTNLTRAAAWAERLARWKAEGLRQVFFFVHEPEDRAVPEMAELVVKELNEKADAGLELARPPAAQISLGFT